MQYTERLNNYDMKKQVEFQQKQPDKIPWRQLQDKLQKQANIPIRNSENAAIVPNAHMRGNSGDLTLNFDLVLDRNSLQPLQNPQL